MMCYSIDWLLGFGVFMAALGFAAAAYLIKKQKGMESSYLTGPCGEVLYRENKMKLTINFRGTPLKNKRNPPDF